MWQPSSSDVWRRRGSRQRSRRPAPRNILSANPVSGRPNSASSAHGNRHHRGKGGSGIPILVVAGHHLQHSRRRLRRLRPKGPVWSSQWPKPQAVAEYFVRKWGKPPTTPIKSWAARGRSRRCRSRAPTAVPWRDRRRSSCSTRPGDVVMGEWVGTGRRPSFRWTSPSRIRRN